MNYTELIITTEQAVEISLDLFGIKGKAFPLPGEVDFNFRIKTNDCDGYILKVSRPNEDLNYLEFQQKLLQYVAKNEDLNVAPKVIKDLDKNAISQITDEHGNTRYVRLLTWIPGRVWSSVNPQLDNLRFSLGEQCGLLTLALQGFDHKEAHRTFAWDVTQSLWTKEYTHLFKGQQRAIVEGFQYKFEGIQSIYLNLRKSVVHNDANDNNVVVSDSLVNPTVKAAIDYGDAVHTQIINDLAIACAYAIMNHNDPLDAALPLVKGYHSTFPLKDEELKCLYHAIAMRLVITVTKSAMNKIAEPDNEYLLISEKPAWGVLEKWHTIHPDFAYFSFRAACGIDAHPDASAFEQIARNVNITLNTLFPSINTNAITSLDLSVSSTWLGHEADFSNLDFFQFKIDQLQKEHPDNIIAGGYSEPRSVYTSDAYDKIGNNGRESRTIHLGVDFWLPEQTPVHAILDGEVITAAYNNNDKDYGGLIILKHKVQEVTFYSLYGHLSKDSITDKQPGDYIKKGDCIAYLGDQSENGGWVPHLHFQLMLSMLEYTNDFPGVTYFNQLPVWQSICPDPNLLFNVDMLNQKEEITNDELITYRKKHLGKSLSLQYKVPIKMVRGAGQYLIDQFGRKYLDTVNNVAHVGHEHPKVVKAGQNQIALLNTNSRYLHKNISCISDMTDE